MTLPEEPLNMGGTNPISGVECGALQSQVILNGTEKRRVQQEYNSLSEEGRQAEPGDKLAEEYRYFENAEIRAKGLYNQCLGFSKNQENQEYYKVEPLVQPENQ